MIEILISVPYAVTSIDVVNDKLSMDVENLATRCSGLIYTTREHALVKEAPVSYAQFRADSSGSIAEHQPAVMVHVKNYGFREPNVYVESADFTHIDDAAALRLKLLGIAHNNDMSFETLTVLTKKRNITTQPQASIAEVVDALYQQRIYAGIERFDA